MPLGKFYVVVADGQNNRTSVQDFGDETEAREYAARSVDKGGYLVAYIYTLLAACRSPTPKVQWTDDVPKLPKAK